MTERRPSGSAPLTPIVVAFRNITDRFSMAAAGDCHEQGRGSPDTAAALDLEAKIGELDMMISQLDDERERQDCARALGDVIGIISEHFGRRIARQYPELDPDR